MPVATASSPVNLQHHHSVQQHPLRTKTAPPPISLPFPSSHSGASMLPPMSSDDSFLSMPSHHHQSYMNSYNSHHHQHQPQQQQQQQQQWNHHHNQHDQQQQYHHQQQPQQQHHHNHQHQQQHQGLQAPQMSVNSTGVRPSSLQISIPSQSEHGLFNNNHHHNNNNMNNNHNHNNNQMQSMMPNSYDSMMGFNSSSFNHRQIGPCMDNRQQVPIKSNNQSQMFNAFNNNNNNNNQLSSYPSQSLNFNNNFNSGHFMQPTMAATIAQAVPIASHNMPAPSPLPAYKSVIECGMLVEDAKTKKMVRKTSTHSEFFGEDTKVYTATADPTRRVLFKAARLAQKLECAPNMLAMYLARRKKLANSGIFQATSFKYKVEPRSGLKTGGYFVSEAACQEFERYYFSARSYRGRGGKDDVDGVSQNSGSLSDSLPHSQTGSTTSGQHHQHQSQHNQHSHSHSHSHHHHQPQHHQHSNNNLNLNLNSHLLSSGNDVNMDVQRASAHHAAEIVMQSTNSGIKRSYADMSETDECPSVFTSVRLSPSSPPEQPTDCLLGGPHSSGLLHSDSHSHLLSHSLGHSHSHNFSSNSHSLSFSSSSFLSSTTDLLCPGTYGHVTSSVLSTLEEERKIPAGDVISSSDDDALPVTQLHYANGGGAHAPQQPIEDPHRNVSSSSDEPATKRAKSDPAAMIAEPVSLF